MADFDEFDTNDGPADLFGAASAAAGDLFGAASAAAGGLFGAASAAAGGLFGAPPLDFLKSGNRTQIDLNDEANLADLEDADLMAHIAAARAAAADADSRAGDLPHAADLAAAAGGAAAAASGAADALTAHSAVLSAAAAAFSATWAGHAPPPAARRAAARLSDLVAEAAAIEADVGKMRQAYADAVSGFAARLAGAATPATVELNSADVTAQRAASAAVTALASHRINVAEAAALLGGCHNPLEEAFDAAVAAADSIERDVEYARRGYATAVGGYARHVALATAAAQALAA